MSNHVYKGAWTKKECQSFTQRLESTWNKQQKAKKMERKFVGHVISGGPVTMEKAREAGLIKGEPKESTQEELDEAVKTMKGIEEAVKKVKEDGAQGTNIE